MILGKANMILSYKENSLNWVLSVTILKQPQMLAGYLGLGK